MKELRLKLFKENRIEGKILMDFKDRKIPEFLSPRRFNGIIDYIYLGLIPPLNDLYRNDLVNPFQELLRKEPYNILTSDKSMIEAAFLSHAHIDHYNQVIAALQINKTIYV